MFLSALAITDCKGGQGPAVAEAPAEQPKQPARTPATRQPPVQQRPPQPRAQQPGFFPTTR